MVSAVARGRMNGPDEEDDQKMVFKDRVFATQRYIPWFIGKLRLGDKIDMSRVRQNQVRVLVGHNGQLPVGNVTRARHDRETERFRSDFEIPKIDATNDVRQRINAGLMRDISVGAKLNWNTITLDNPDDDWESFDDTLWTAHEWEYVEQSLTPIPADGQAGIDRAGILDLLREDDDLIVFGLESAIMLQRTDDKYRPRFVQTISENRRGKAMTTSGTPLSAVDALEQARREAQVKRDADNEQAVQLRAIASLEVESQEQKGIITSLQQVVTEARTSLDEALAGRESDAIEIRDLRTNLTSFQEMVAAAKADREAEKVTREEEEKRNMEYRAKLDRLQFQPNGPVLQLTNWKPGDHLLSMGNIIKLTWQGGMTPDSPLIDPGKVTLEESFLEQRDSSLKEMPSRHPQSANTVAVVPFSALAERERQEMMLRNSNMASGVGVRPLDITVLGDAGLVLSRYAPILATMNVEMGVVGDQKLAYLSAQDDPTPNTEGAAITAGTWTIGGTNMQPHTIPAAFQMTTSLRAIDDGTFERVVRQSIFMVLNNGVVKQVLIGTGTAPQIAGMWSKTGVQNVNYGAAASDFNRADALDVLNSVRLANSDGSAPVMVASKGLWELMERTPRGEKTYAAGTAAQGYGAGITEITKFLMDDIMHMDEGVMGMVEGATCYYYSDLSPSSATNPGLVFKGNRAVVWFWGDSLALEYVPQVNANYYYKMCAEVNADFELPSSNFARIKQT